MKIVSFWSYKGGTGRTLTLCNVAVELAKKGKNVGIVDLDFEAPGVHVLFNLDENKIKNQGSLIDLLIHQTLGNLSKFIYDLSELNLIHDIRGKIFLLPSINTPDLDSIVFDNPQFLFMRNIFDNFIKIYLLDYLLIDTRTGFSTMAGLGAKYADKTFICMRPDRQNILGVQQTIRAFDVKNIDYCFIFCSVPIIKESKTRLQEAERILNSKIDVKIDLVPELILNEKIFSLVEPQHPICKSYQKISKIIEEVNDR